MMDLFRGALLQFRDTDTIKVMLIRATGRYFCAGADLKGGMNEQARRWSGPVKTLTAEELAEHHAVSQLCKIYAIGMDMRDYDLARNAFADDARIEGRDGFEPVNDSLPQTYAIASSFQATQHVIANQ